MLWTILIGFLVVVIGTYIGARMALRSFFGRDFVNPETGEFTLPESAFDDSVKESDR